MSATKEPAETRAGGEIDIPTVIAVAVVAYAVANILHEGLGHGGTCVLTGGTLQVISAVHCECEEEAISPVARKLISASGTIVNLIAGSAALGLLRAQIVKGPVGRYFLWLFM